MMQSNTTNVMTRRFVSGEALRNTARPQRGQARSVLVFRTRASAADVLVEEKQAVSLPRRKITGKTVVITGGSQGCGRAAALKFAGKGYNVVVAARAPERLEAVAEEIMLKSNNKAGAGMAVATDITDPESVKQLAERVCETYESVDVLINNAGVCCSGPFADTTLEDWNNQLNVNCMGAVAVTQAFLPKILESRGSIVCVNSFGGVMPLRNMTAYTASKYALAGFTDALRYELAPKGVHVAQVHPGVINSDFLERAQFRGDAAEKTQQTMSKMLNSGFAQKPEEIADAVIEAIETKKNEIVVGAFFKAAVGAYRLTGANPFAMDTPEL